MPPWLYGVIIPLVLVGIGLFFLLRWVKACKQAALDDLWQRYRPEDLLYHEPNANSFGQTSLGVTQVRGNGVLALTADELWFRMWVPARALAVSRSAIVRVSTVTSHLGKTEFRDLLFVEWRLDDGATDSIAFLVADLDRWLTVLDEQRAS